MGNRLLMTIICTAWVTLGITSIGDARPCVGGVYDWTIALNVAMMVLPIAFLSFMAGRESK